MRELGDERGGCVMRQRGWEDWFPHQLRQPHTGVPRPPLRLPQLWDQDLLHPLVRGLSTLTSASWPVCPPGPAYRLSSSPPPALNVCRPHAASPPPTLKCSKVSPILGWQGCHLSFFTSAQNWNFSNSSVILYKLIQGYDDVMPNTNRKQWVHAAHNVCRIIRRGIVFTWGNEGT